MRRSAKWLVVVGVLVFSPLILNAQAGCTKTKAILCDGKSVCTTDAGSTCVTCPADS